MSNWKHSCNLPYYFPIVSLVLALGKHGYKSLLKVQWSMLQWEKNVVLTQNYIWQTPQPNPQIKLSGLSNITIGVYSIASVIYKDFAVNLRLYILISKRENQGLVIFFLRVWLSHVFYYRGGGNLSFKWCYNLCSFPLQIQK